MQLRWDQIEAKLREIGWSADTLKKAAAAYAEEREAESRSHFNQDLQYDQSTRFSRGGQAADGTRVEDTQPDGEGEQELTKEEKRNIREKMKKLKLEGRLLPDSSMTTYFGKPAFHAYGNGNVRPASGGLVYGEYLKTHNINPHSGDNKPEKTQVYGRAMCNPKVVVSKPGRQSTASPGKKGIKDLQAA